MYQKRLRGYAELGYQAKADSDSGKMSVIFDNQTFYAPFAADIAEIGYDALIISPFIRKARVASVMKLLAVPLKQNVKITIITRPPEDYKPEQQPGIVQLVDMMQTESITVITRGGIHQKYAVFDKTVVWYGSIIFLSFGNSEESIMRFENSTIAGELLDAANME
jgi:hypothetical protein